MGWFLFFFFPLSFFLSSPPCAGTDLRRSTTLRGWTDEAGGLKDNGFVSTGGGAFIGLRLPGDSSLIFRRG